MKLLSPLAQSVSIKASKYWFPQIREFGRGYTSELHKHDADIEARQLFDR